MFEETKNTANEGRRAGLVNPTAVAAELHIPAILLYRDHPDGITAAAAHLAAPEDPCAILAAIDSLLQTRAQADRC